MADDLATAVERVRAFAGNAPSPLGHAIRTVLAAVPSSPPASDLAAARERQNDDARVITVDGKRYMHFNGVWSKERDDGWYIIAEKVPAFDRIVELEDETVRMRAEIDRLGDGDDSARLDFIEQSGQAIRVLPLHEHPHRYVVIDDTLAAVASPVPSWYGDTLRDAIDAARTAPGATNG